MRRRSLREWARIAVILTSVGVVAAAMMPLQYLAIRVNRPLARRLPRIFHGLVCRFIGIRVHAIGEPIDGAVLVVANHVSWLDIPAIGQGAPVSFIAKSDVRDWPVFGSFARLQRSVFVDRSQRGRTGDVVSQIRERLADSEALVLFAEGTSGDGTRLLPFRSALFGALMPTSAAASAPFSEPRYPVALKPTIAVQPLSIAYIARGGIRLGRRERAALAWYGDMDLVPHLMEILSRGTIDVELRWGAPLAVKPQTDRKILARLLEERVRAGLRASRAAPFGERSHSRSLA